MNTNTAHGPWSTSIESSRESRLSTFWKRRLAQLSAINATGPGLHKRSAVFLTAVALVALAWPTWQLGPEAGDAPVVSADKRNASADAEPPMSIFNDQLRRFKFRIDHAVVTHEEARAFMERYSTRGNPAIIGAYADADTNSLVVIGPPEAEQAIRKSLATWIVVLQDLNHAIDGPPLEIEQRKLMDDRSELIRTIAGVEVAKVKAAAAKDRRADDKVQRLDGALKALEAELQVVEQQIRILKKHLERLHADPSGAER